MDSRRSVFLGIVLVIWLAIGSFAAMADDFRIDNTASVDGQKEPASESTTIFCGGAVYDYMTVPAETVVFDEAAGQFTLLNLKSRTRAELTTSELAAFSERLQQLAAKSHEPVVRFLAAPKFQEHFDATGGELSLASRWVKYRVLLSPESDRAAVEQYHLFSDWYARLNALLLPGSRPPFARLVVNAAVAQHDSLPAYVALTIDTGKSNRQSITVHSTHHLVRPLALSDVDCAAKTRKLISDFQLISFDQYRKLKLR